ncbi:family 43 glycosylhydrolase [Cellulosimicrobium cellulans]|uniref:family 43 glycosylhydrolase n=1 Tax=Cellulosimicrobium cellulans TaxID=1710 RepID=UPI0008484432|nr:family 43 glycosylhydrolase [Cellulosimicrobium cellulans]
MRRTLAAASAAVLALLVGGTVAPAVAGTTSPDGTAPGTTVLDAEPPAVVPDLTTAEAGNPIIDGWYADPDVEFYEGEYWIFPTTSAPYGEQVQLDAFSSPDMVHWTKHERVLHLDDVSWGEYALWAPAPVERDGKYYLYFGVNDIQSDAALGGIGVAVADRPEGPYVDALGEPLIDAFHNGAQPIDQDVFVDDDGQAYMYYGGWGHANVVELNDDMISLGTHDDGSTFKEITPEGYVEGSFMFKRNGTYYLMWSEGGWTGPDYRVSYARSDSPLGPFESEGTVLAQDPAVARGSGHNSVVNVPGTDIWYIVYHRRPLSETDGNSRQVAYERLYFEEDGSIRPIEMKVQDNFEDDNDLGWTTHGGTWTATGGEYVVGSVREGKSVQDTNFADLDYRVTVTPTAVAATGGDAGVIFRASQVAAGQDAYRGYYAGVRPSGQVVLGKVDDRGWSTLGTAPADAGLGESTQLRVVAVGPNLRVYVGDATAPAISVTDGTFASGKHGLRVFDSAARFDDVAIERRVLDVGVEVGAGAVRAGGAADLDVTVTNTAGEARTVDLTATAPDGWTAALPVTSLDVAAGATETFTLPVTAASGAAEGVHPVSVSASWDDWTAAGTGYVAVIEDVFEAHPSTPEESVWLAADDRSQIGPHGAGQWVRYTDNDRSYTYEVPLPAGVRAGTVTLDIGNQFLVEASSDQETWVEVLRETREERALGNRAERELDVATLLEQTGSTDGSLYLRFRDSFPADGWGSWLRTARLEIDATPAPVVTVQAESRCLAGTAYVAVRATNGGDAPVDVEIETAYGTTTRLGVEPGRNAYQAFSSRAAGIDAGTVTVTVTATSPGGAPHAQQVEVPGRTC